MNIGLKCNHKYQSFGKKGSFCADDFWRAFQTWLQKQKNNLLPLLFFEPSNSVEDEFSGIEERIFSQNDSSSNFRVFESEKVPSRKLWQRQKKRFESSIQSNLVNDTIFKVHFITFAKVFERYLSSLAFYDKFALNQMKNVRGKSVLCWIFPNFFNSIWTLGKTFLSGVSNLQSKCT